MRRLTLLCALLLGVAALALPACPEPEGEGLPPVVATDAGDVAFVERATLLVLGRRPVGRGELSDMVETVDAVGRSEFVRGLASDAVYRVDYRGRWTDLLLDLFQVPRGGARINVACFAAALLDEPTSDLAAHVRDNPPTAPFELQWTMQDLIVSALELDDISVVYRAELFSSTVPGAPPPTLVEAEAHRSTRGTAFEAAWLGRDLNCLPCHNSEFSVTGDADPSLDRTWEVPGLFEAALFGDSSGMPPESLYSLFRRSGVVWLFAAGDADDPPIPPGITGPPGCIPTEEPGCDGCACEPEVCPNGNDNPCCGDNWGFDCVQACRNSGAVDCSSADLTVGSLRPWGNHDACGLFRPPDDLGPDPLGGSGYLGGGIGADGSVYDIEALMAQGVEELRGEDLSISGQLEVPASQALAFLAAMAMADVVWEQHAGRPLTVPHGFPRNEYQRDTLEAMAREFATSGFSLIELLVAATESPWFNPALPSQEPEAGAWPLPAIFDPWVIAADSKEERGNGVGDLVHRLPVRVSRRAAAAALDWRPPETWPENAEGPLGSLLAGVGAFVKESEPGFSGLSFQSTLAWEDLVGGCKDLRFNEEAPGCSPRVEPGCDGGCTCEEPVCAQMPSCCTGSWDATCVALCRRTVGCGLIPSGEADAIEALLDDARSRPGDDPMLLSEALAHLKDRILLDTLWDDEERALLAALLGRPLDSELLAVGDPAAEDGLRLACGTWLASPGFVLSGLPLQ